MLFVLFFVETLVVDDVGAMGENKTKQGLVIYSHVYWVEQSRMGFILKINIRKNTITLDTNRSIR